MQAFCFIASSVNIHAFFSLAVMGGLYVYKIEAKEKSDNWVRVQLRMKHDT
jgi:hypothetical protein